MTADHSRHPLPSAAGDTLPRGIPRGPARAKWCLNLLHSCATQEPTTAESDDVAAGRHPGAQPSLRPGNPRRPAARGRDPLLRALARAQQGLALGGLPPLAPPVGADQDLQLGVVAVGDLLVFAGVVPAVVAALLAVG